MSTDKPAVTDRDRPSDPAEELASLVGGLRSHLGWLAGQGLSYVPAGPTPRFAEPVEAPPPAEVLPDPPADAPPGAGAPDDLAVLTSPGLGAAGLARIRECLGDCHRCRLSQDRVQVVFGQGNPEADLIFVGEAPGRDEDLAGQVFVGAAGQLLTRMIKAMGFDREQVFIGNVIKCRPPRNRNPEPDEIARCQPFLMAQIRAIEPQVIVTLGRFAAQTLLQTDASIGKLRGRLHRFTLDDREMVLLPTYHPAYLLRNREAKRPVWEDLQLVMAWLKERGPGN
jgi:DNA polymerase